jgi:Ca-activated chloride channel family protein
MVRLLVQLAGRRTLRIVPPIIGGLLAFAAPHLYGQFTSNVNLVEVYATVTDSGGRPITGLTAADFQVSEDGRPQAITTFAFGEVPLSVAVAIDRSFSMAGKRLTLALDGARRFVNALRPTDEVMVLTIGSQVETVRSPVDARTAATIAWDSIDAWGSTPLYDAALEALEVIAGRRGRRALLLISDGVDRGSHTSATELLARARRAGVLVYPVTIGRTAAPVFVELAGVTGGRASSADEPSQVQAAVAAVARELRFQYLLGYVPPPRAAGTDSGEWRSIEVKLARSGARVRARDGYVAR